MSLLASLVCTPRTWRCTRCIRVISPQRRTLRVRPTARRPPPELQRLPPSTTLTLSDGSTIRIQGDAPARASGKQDEEKEKLEELSSAKKASKSLFTPSSHDLVPSAPSAPLAPKSPTPTTPPQSSTSAGSPWNWYFETVAPTPPQTTHASAFFHSASAKLLRSVAQFRLCPESDVPEVAFIGRSNAGKSSLLNALLGLDTKALLARTSRTPGFTTTMNMYGLGPSGVTIKKQPSGRDKIVGRGGVTIVDMPGYGEGSLSAWGVEIMKYIQSRKQLRRVFVLLDASHGIKDKDRSVLASLRLAGVSHQVVLSKLDKLYIPPSGEVRRFDGRALARLKPHGTTEELRKKMSGLLPDIKPPIGGGALGEVLGCSAEVKVDGERLGIDDVRFAVLKAVGLEGVSMGKGVGKGKGKGKKGAK